MIFLCAVSFGSEGSAAWMIGWRECTVLPDGRQDGPGDPLLEGAGRAGFLEPRIRAVEADLGDHHQRGLAQQTAIHLSLVRGVCHMAGDGHRGVRVAKCPANVSRNEPGLAALGDRAEVQATPGCCKRTQSCCGAYLLALR